MTRWDLIAGDKSQTVLIATLDEQRITPGGDIFAPSLTLPFGWQELVPGTGDLRDASGRVIAVSIDLHIYQAPNRYWVRTGLQPVSRTQIPILSLTHTLIEALSAAIHANPDSDVALNISVQALATEQGSPSSIRTHWHMNSQAVRVGAAQWRAMLRHWGYPAVRLVPLSLELPTGVGEHNKAARDLWSAACGRLRTAQQEWADGNATDAGEELRHVVQMAIRAWGALWYPDRPPEEREDWSRISRRIAEDTPGCDPEDWTISPQASEDAQRTFAFLTLLRNLNSIANPFHHVGAAPAYTRADVDMLVTVGTAVMRSLPEFWRQFPAPLRAGAAEPGSGA
jgi:hypothetical protein